MPTLQVLLVNPFHLGETHRAAGFALRIFACALRLCCNASVTEEH